MTREHRLESHEWRRLETLWETARALPPDKRREFVESLAADGAVQAELESLLAGSAAAEAFFDRLRAVVPDATRALTPPGLEGDPHEKGGMREGRAFPERNSLIGAMVGQYRIEALLGEGGMGLVYRAIDTRLRRTVALKLLRQRTGDDERTKERLLAEARAAAALDHPNICTVYEVGETAEHLWFIAMSHYAGETLDRVLRRGPLSLTMALDYATQIARGLGAAHERGIIHRDVKPANVIVTGEGVLKLLDFGIARGPDDGASFGEMTPGTIAYMSPEQLTSQPVDHRTDLWSLGVVLYELCTGVRPFRGNDVGTTVRAILRDTPPHVAGVRPDLPPHVDSIVDRLLTKDPRQRYQDATALIADLRQNRTATAPAPAAGQSVKRRFSSRVTALAIGALILVWPWTPASDSDRVGGADVSERRMAAIDLYNQGHVDVLFRTDSGRRRARDFFTRAIAMDSTYAPAYASLAHMLADPSDSSRGRRARLAIAERHARTAITLDSSLAEGHAALGHVLLLDYRLAEAEQSLKRANDLQPVSPRPIGQGGLRPEYAGEFLVGLYIFTNRPREALHQAELNAKANPHAPTAIAEVARGLLVNGRCDEALQMLDRLSSMEPPPARTAAIAAQCYARRQMWQKAIDGLRPVAARNPGQPEAWLGYMLARAGQAAEARRIRDRLLEREKHGSGGAYGVATIYAGLRDFAKAFEWLDRAIDDRSLVFSIMEPAFEELHRDPRFDRLRHRLGIRKR